MHGHDHAIYMYMRRNMCHGADLDHQYRNTWPLLKCHICGGVGVKKLVCRVEPEKARASKFFHTLQLTQGRHASELPSGFTTVSAGGNPDTTGVPGTVLLSPDMTAGAWVLVRLKKSTLQCAGKLACMASLKKPGWQIILP